MDKDSLREGLSEAGLTQYESDAYLAVLDRGSSPVVDVATAAKIPKSRVYDVVRNLESKGYVETYEQDSLHVRARDPGDVLARLHGRAETLTQTAAEIEARWEQPDLGDHKVTIVKRASSVVEWFTECARAADNQIQLAVTPSDVRAVAPALTEAISNGVFVKLCLLETAPEEDAWSELPAFETVATEVRHRPLPAPFVAIIDRSYTCFAPRARATEEYGILVDDPTLAYVFHWYFQSALWETWETVYAAATEEGYATYVNLRACIRDVAPLIEDGQDVVVCVDGFEIDTGNSVSVTGRVTETRYAKAAVDESLPLAQLAGRATLVVESEGAAYTVGGWGAMLEDIEATRTVVDFAASEAATHRGAER
ncbi:TrmB family transcriptional regulator [Haloferacaceae archaeon DSL9]